MATTVINRDLLKRLRVDIDEALLDVRKKYGLRSLAATGAKFTDGDFTFKLEGIAEGALDPEARLYVSDGASFLGLPPLGTQFVSGGVPYKTAGLNKTGSKVICSRADGKRYLFTVDAVQRLCKVAPRPVNVTVVADGLLGSRS